MVKLNRISILLLSIFTFSFVYRMVLMLWTGFPPGADIGLHNSVIYSITGSGNTDFLYNYYHIGGGVSLTFPGYHIFTAGVILFTGLPEYIAQATVVALFSALIVLCSFLITKKVFSTSAACIVAFLAMVSRFDIEMITWAGYPNIITLMLIPLVYFLYLEKDRFSKVPFFVSTAILIGSVFLTHSLSSLILVGIFVPVALFVLLWPKTMCANRRSVVYWVLPIVFGAALVSPFLIKAIPTYLVEYGSEASLSQILPYWIVIPLFGIVAAFFLFSIKYYRKVLVLPTFLLATWVFVPLISTQGYLVGLAVDYNRFLYFLVLPIMVFIGILIDHGSETLALGIEKSRGSIHSTYRIQVHPAFLGLQRKIENTQRRLSAAATQKRLYSFFVLFFLLFSFILLPIFVTPTSLNVGQTLQSYYQTMDNPKWEAMQWIKQNTSENSVIVADALFGWWLGGFTQRQTLSGNNPEFLTLKREVYNATFARNLLDTNYMIGNEYIQIREDGGYITRHNPEFLVNVTNEYYLYPFFNYDNGQTIVTLLLTLSDGSKKTMEYSLSSLEVLDMYRESTASTESISITHGNDLFNFTQITTLPLGSQFAQMTQKISTNNPAVTLVTLSCGLATKGSPIISDDYSTVAYVDTGMKSIGEIIFPDVESRPSRVDVSSPAKIVFALDGKKSSQFIYYMGVYQYTDEQLRQINSGQLTYSQIIIDKSHNYSANSVSDKAESKFTVFDYLEELALHKATYVVLAIDDNPIPEKTEIEVYEKFSNDPLFSLVFINEEVAIYKVNG